MKFLDTLAFAIIASAISVTVSHASTLEEIKNATYLLYQGESKICTTEFINPNVLLTAAHCIENDEDTGFNIRDKVNDKIYFLKIGKVNHDTDTATLLVVTEHDPFPAVDIAPREAVPFGTPVITVGYPETDEMMVTDGLISSLTVLKGFEGKNPIAYKTNVDIAPGSSGGGLYREIDGEYYLIGTASATWARDPWISFFTTPGDVWTVLDGYSFEVYKDNGL